MREPPVPFTAEPNVADHLAWMRTLLGLQRTHMAVVRTAVTLIGFGFTVAEFFTRMRLGGPGGVAGFGSHAPRNLGLVLIAAGVVSLGGFTFQYRRAIDYLRSPAFEPIAGIGRQAMIMPVYLTSLTVMLIGAAAFATVLLRL